MRRMLANMFCVFFSFFRIIILKLFHPIAFKSSLIQRISPNVKITFAKGSRVYLGKKIRIHSGSKIKVSKGAVFSIGDDAKMNNNCVVNCRCKISIGEGAEFGPNVLLFDHDHIHDYSTGMNNGYNTGEIIIGKHVWIGANTLILRGTKIGDNSVVGAGSVLKGEYPSCSLIIQKRADEVISKVTNVNKE